MDGGGESFRRFYFRERKRINAEHAEIAEFAEKKSGEEFTERNIIAGYGQQTDCTDIAGDGFAFAD